MVSPQLSNGPTAACQEVQGNLGALRARVKRICDAYWSLRIEPDGDRYRAAGGQPVLFAAFNLGMKRGGRILPQRLRRAMGID